jgi:hypothetical protein
MKSIANVIRNFYLTFKCILGGLRKKKADPNLEGNDPNCLGADDRQATSDVTNMVEAISQMALDLLGRDDAPPPSQQQQQQQPDSIRPRTPVPPPPPQQQQQQQTQQVVVQIHRDGDQDPANIV